MNNAKYVLNTLPPSVSPEHLSMLEGVETATVGHFRMMGFASGDIQPLKKGNRLAGTAVTLALPGWDSTLLHHVLSQLREGDILVIDRLGETSASCLGGGVAYALRNAGVIAAIIDGVCNDPYEILEYEFPVWSRGISPITTRLYNTGGAFNVPVCCGGAVVHPGDVVLADDNGVLFFPREEIGEIAEKSLQLQNMEKAALPTLSKENQLGDMTGATAMVLAAMAAD